MRTDLFRPQALDARKERWLGSIRLPLTRMGAAMAALALTALLAAIALLVFGRATRSERAEGWLVEAPAPAQADAPPAWQVELWLPERAIAAVRPGNDVVLRYRAFPSAVHGLQRGRVVSVPESMTPAQSRARTGRDEALWRVRVEPAASALDRRALRPRMRVDAELPIAREPLYRFMLAPRAALAKQAP